MGNVWKRWGLAFGLALCCVGGWGASVLAEDSGDQLRVIEQSRTQFFSDLQKFLSASPKGTYDIDPRLFQDFWTQWPLVTTRYKPYEQELRFIYVNKIGAEAFRKGGAFPEGTVFAKIGASAIHDPLFDSSLMPGGVSRVQVMLKDSRNPKARDGWVYALLAPPFDKSSLSKDGIDACAACHALVKPRDEIFALPFPLAASAAAYALDRKALAQRFAETPLSALSDEERQVLQGSAPKSKSVLRYVMPLFDGSFVESEELLAGLAKTAHEPYVLESPDRETVLIALPSTGACFHMVTKVPHMPFSAQERCGDQGQGVLVPK